MLSLHGIPDYRAPSPPAHESNRNVKVPPQFLGVIPPLIPKEPDQQSPKGTRIKAKGTSASNRASSQAKKFKKNLIPIPRSSPFYGTDLIVFKKDYDGKLPSNGIKELDYNQLCDDYTLLCQGRGNINIVGVRGFREIVLEAIKHLCTREIGRELFFSILYHEDKTLTISPITDTNRIDSAVPGNTNKEATIYLSLNEMQAIHRTISGSRYGEKIPTFIVLAHEMIHTLHMFDADTIDAYNKGLLDKPTLGKDFSNREEEDTIVPKNHENITENAIRTAFGLPPREGHTGFFSPPNPSNVHDCATQRYFLDVCSLGVRKNVEELLRLGINPNLVGVSNGRVLSALMIAAENGHFDIVLLLLQAGAKHDSISQEGLTLLHYVIRGGNYPLLTFLVDHGVIHVNVADKVSKPLIHFAIEELKENCAAVVQYLVMRGANFAALDARGQTALHAAAGVGEMRLFFWLERIGLNRLLHDFDGLLPMHHALKAGCWTLFESLCQSKRELYYLTPSGQSLMVYGMLSGNKQIVESLLRLAKHLAPEDEIKEFFSRPDSLGFPPLAYAFYNSCPDGRREFVRDMLALQFSFGPEQCAAIVSLFVEDNSPGRFETLDLIYRNCGMIDLPICHGTTLLQWASQNGDIPLAAYALSRGAAINPSPTPDLPATPLIGATIHNQAAMVQFLLSQGADPFLQNLTGDSPVELILERCVKNEPIDIGIFNLLYEAMKLQFESIIASSVAVQTIAAPLTIDPKMVFPAEPS